MLTNPFTGQMIEFISEDEDLLVIRSTIKASGAPAPAHFHPAQDEHFTVLSGAVRASVDGEATILHEGDELVIPAGTPHEFGGAPDEDGTVRWEIRPPLRAREFFEGLFGSLNEIADAQAAGVPPPDPPSFDVAAYDDVFRIP